MQPNISLQSAKKHTRSQPITNTVKQEQRITREELWKHIVVEHFMPYREAECRQAKATADAIDAGIFDVKAVNPNAIVKNDTRTPDEVIQSIEDQGKIVAKALEALRALLQA